MKLKIKNRLKYKHLPFGVTTATLLIVLLGLWKISVVEFSQTERLNQLDVTYGKLSELINSEKKQREKLEQALKKSPEEVHTEENADLKTRSLEYSPDGNKVAYYQHKLVDDIEKIGDPDYTSLIVEQNGKTKVVFQGNFRLSTFEWLNNNEIKVYKGCGSSCLLSYVVNVQSKKYKESVEKIFSFE